MNRFEQTLGVIDAFCRQHSLPYAVIGGIAAIVYQNPRTTQDIDITLSVELENIRATGEKLLFSFKALKQNPLDFFDQYFVLPVIYEPTKVRVDFAAGASGFEKNAINRSKRLKFGQVEISVCTLEDLTIQAGGLKLSRPGRYRVLDGKILSCSGYSIPEKHGPTICRARSQGCAGKIIGICESFSADQFGILLK